MIRQNKSETIVPASSYNNESFVNRHSPSHGFASVIVLAVIFLLAASSVNLKSLAYAAKPVRGPGHEIIVSKDGHGDFTSIQEAFVSITDASADNRYLITVMPGFYDWNYWLDLDYIDIRGSGIDNTRVKVGYGLATASNTMISDITLIGGHSSQPPIAIYYGGNITLTNVHINSSGAGAAISVSNNTPTNIVLKNTIINSVEYGISLLGHAPVTLSMENVHIDSQYQGIYTGEATQSELTIKNSTIKGSTSAVVINSHTGYVNIDVNNSSLIGADALLDMGTVSGMTRIAGSKIAGYINADPSAYKLVNNFDGNFNPIADH